MFSGSSISPTKSEQLLAGNLRAQSIFPVPGSKKNKTPASHLSVLHVMTKVTHPDNAPMLEWRQWARTCHSPLTSQLLHVWLLLMPSHVGNRLGIRLASHGKRPQTVSSKRGKASLSGSLRTGNPIAWEGGLSPVLQGGWWRVEARCQHIGSEQKTSP